MTRNLLLFLASVLMVSHAEAQTGKVWSLHKDGGAKITTDKGVARSSFPKEFKLFDLNISPLRQELFSVVDGVSKHSTIISLPNADGKIEQFEVFEASNFDPALQAKYPQIRAYSGKGITDKYATLKLSISPQGIQTMVFRTDRENEFIEPYSQDKTVYAVFKSQREKGKLSWTCSVADKKLVSDILPQVQNTQRSSAGELKTMRLAQSCNGEYAAYFGATTAGTPADKALVNAAFNATLTRCNGVYEKDLALHLNLVATNDNIIYCNPAADPYSATLANWNAELQNAISSTLTGVATTLAANNAAYDIGHMFGATGGGGNAGCIGCVCVDDTASTTDQNKGSGITSPADGIPQGDNFDIDYVVHEVGHQLGGNHTFSMSNEGYGVNMEVGSGVTIMGYAGITAQDVAPHSIDVYHAASIAQIQTNLAGKSCPVTTNITANNATPVVNAGADYTIPINTPFILTGSATDANAGDVLTYSWEQYDDGVGQTAANSAARINKPTGPNWRSYSPSASPVRYMPQLSTILANQATTAGAEINVEALSSVARTLNFRLTARDNVAFSSTAPVKVGQTNFDAMVITTDATRGPLTITSQNVANQSWLQGSTQTVTWAVNNTNGSAGGANVDILLSTDGGLTYPTVLVAATPNDGSQSITVPNILSTNARIMVKASGSIFFNVNTTPILIGYTATTTCNSYSVTPVAPGIAIPDNINTYTYVPVSVSDTNNISDVNLTVSVTHTWVSDVRISLRNPAATTEATAYSGSCTGSTYDNINATFDDQGAAIVCTAPTITGIIIPSTPFSAFNGQNPSGTWNVGVKDVAASDTGHLASYTLNICSQIFTLSNSEFEFADFALYPNPNSGDFTVKFTSTSSNDIKVNVHDIRGRQVYEKSFSNTGAFNQNINLEKVQSGIYLVSILDGDKKTVKRIVVE